MTVITAKMVAKLREKTDAPMMECKKALTEAAGDMDKAEEILRVRLGNKASKAADRVTAEGLIGVYINTNSTHAAMVEINCETDFVSKNDEFIAFTDNLAQLISEKAISDVSALSVTHFKDSDVDTVRKALIGKVGENISIRRFKAVNPTTGKVASYVHNGRIGVLVEYIGDDLAAKDVAMHIAATKPVALNEAGVDSALIEKERSVASLKAAEAGKSAELTIKMVDGSVAKFLKEVSLMTQAFVKNDKLTIEQFLKSKNTTVSAFTIYVVGEGIEKKTVDFATEVAEQAAAAAAAKALVG
jgi:elongation factor Ts